MVRLLWFIVIVIVRLLSVSILTIRLSLWLYAGKEPTSWLSAFAVLLNAVLSVCIPFPFHVWGRLWNSIVSVPHPSPFIYFATCTGWNSFFLSVVYSVSFFPILLYPCLSPLFQSKKISNDHELIQSDPTSCPQNQKLFDRATKLSNMSLNLKIVNNQIFIYIKTASFYSI